MPPMAAHKPATASRTLTPSRWMSRPTNAATTTDPMVLTSRISPRSPTGTPKLWRIVGQADDDEGPETEQVEPAVRTGRAEGGGHWPAQKPGPPVPASDSSAPRS